jgi:hypothetical protein
VFLCLAALSAWIVWDLAAPVHGNLHDFDPHEVARMETSMWRAYYDHRSVALFTELARLLRIEYHLPFWRSWVGAWHAARAAAVFQRGHDRPEYERAMPDLQAFYRLIRGVADVPFDVDRAARLELEWWIIHRQRASHNAGDLEQALAGLQAEIYREPATRFELHAKLRADAMILRDTRAEAGALTDGDWARIAGMLDTSWTSLRVAVGR